MAAVFCRHTGKLVSNVGQMLYPFSTIRAVGGNTQLADVPVFKQRTQQTKFNKTTTHS